LTYLETLRYGLVFGESPLPTAFFVPNRRMQVTRTMREDEIDV
jgi:hypothetical protein